MEFTGLRIYTNYPIEYGIICFMSRIEAAEKLVWSDEEKRRFEQAENERASRGGDTMNLLEFEGVGNNTSSRVYNNLRRMHVRTAEGVKELLETGKMPRKFGGKTWGIVRNAYERFQQQYADKSPEKLGVLVEEQRERFFNGPLQAGMILREIEEFRREEEGLAEEGKPGLDQLGWLTYYGEDTALRHLLEEFGVKTIEGARRIAESGHSIWGVGPERMRRLQELLEDYDATHPN